ncbi:MAG: hypothetical protein IKJ99_05265 [Oscillospiraceae bacterium]|nr:hypothetical protein [Oscillospiraceae bacterium]
MKKFLALLLALVMVLSMAACGGNNTEDTQPGAEAGGEATVAPTDPVDTINIAELKSLNNKEYGVDFVSLYSEFGADVTIDQVIEDTATGNAYIEIDGTMYTLGLDFLSRAMVYNTSVPAGGMWQTEDDVYATWWKLYIQRWNNLLPEIPLYANEYYDLYNAQIKGVEEYPTNPYWSPASALIDWTSEKNDTIIIGSSTDLSGKFRYANFGANNPGSADLDVQNLTLGLETVAVTKEGGYVWNDTVVKEHTETDNADGSKTYTITLHDDLKFSDGSAVTAKNYLVTSMLFSTPVGAQAAGKDHMSTMSVVGFESFNAYDGTNAGEGVTKELSGMRLIDDLTFSVTISADYLPYFYAISYGSYTASPVELWIGDCDILDDGNGVYFSDDFYAKDGDSYVMAAHVEDAAWNQDTTYPYSGPYVVESYNEADHSAILKANPYFKGNYEGAVAGIGTVVYKKIVSSTQIADLTSGNLDVIAGITGGDETNEAIALADNSNGAYVYTHYSRAGYGKLGFRADFGPVQFTEVRQAIAYCMDRAQFAKDFTGGYGGVADGPYYTGSWMYKAAVEQGMMLNAYATSVDSAIAVLEQGGWVYNAEGGAYTDGVRYKKIAAEEMLEQDKTFQSKDGAYVVTQDAEGNYYMPLVLNWYGTTDNPFTDLLMTGFASNENIIAAGFNVQYTVGEFNPMLDELYQAPIYGYYAGTPLYTCFNFATGFTSAVYDYSYNLTIDPAEYDNYSLYYLKDMADAYWLQ